METMILFDHVLLTYAHDNTHVCIKLGFTDADASVESKTWSNSNKNYLIIQTEKTRGTSHEIILLALDYPP